MAQVLCAPGRRLYLGSVRSVHIPRSGLGRLFADFVAGPDGACREPCYLRSGEAEYKADAPVCREPANQGGGPAARQVQLPLGPYHEQPRGGLGGILHCAAVWLGDAAVAAHVGPFARVLWRTLAYGYPVRIPSRSLELCHWALDLDIDFLGNCVILSEARRAKSKNPG